jgi:2-polyprenyl-6-hydroxyphenyl methylase/3-demethylubiquinone-9 3-methyltransferase
MTSFENADAKEIVKFDRVSQIWWDPKGEMGTLLTINPLRTNFILENLGVRHPKILDVGCGGGILSEALAQTGAQVTGIDLSQASIQVAVKHAQKQGLEIDYRYESVEEVVQEHAGSFDVVTCMEMLEHVPEPGKIVAACARALKPGGHAVFSTINRTPKAFLFAIIGGEYLMRLLPRGTHTYPKLIRPRELKDWAEGNSLEFSRLSSLIYNPFTRKFKVAAGQEDVNYMAQFIKKNQ